MKAAARRVAPADAAPAEECPRCAARAAGLGTGPFSPGEFMKLAVPLPATPVANHAAVVAATAERDR